MRRPLNRTSVRFAPRPRRSIEAVPVAPFESNALFEVSMDGKLFSTSSIRVKPVALMASESTMDTGATALKLSVRAMREPVTTTSSSSASWA
jgi:hypothetical protein